ncbi:ATP-binding protein [Desulfofundulus kuznetsovii]|uniref:ATP-binding protein n=1 Tax=Desulfofundulus kuznetsovii TaxID=58135 RepID=UPI00338E0AF2
MRETSRNSGTLRFVLPSYPSDLLLAIGCELEERFSRGLDLRVSFKYGIAYRLGKEWQNGTDTDRANFAAICKKGWYNADDNLTNLRNTVKNPDDDCLVILLAGYEHIDDQASLQDFFHLDQQAVWELCLQRSFYDWVHACLKDYVNPDGSEQDFKNIADLFKALYDYGLADVLEVSRYLEKQSFTGVMSGSDAYRLILSDLSYFKLPCMIGLTGRYATRRSFSRYITPAQEFFNYSMFLDASAREKAKKKIEKFRARFGDEQLESDTLGPFASLDELLDALKDYIENRSEAARAQLQTADFIYIYDKILGYREIRGQIEHDPKPRKLSGLPPEVFLRALWITLGDFKKEEKARSVLAAESLRSITLRSTLFKHDFDAGDEGDDKGRAETFLCHVLGGIDGFLEDQLRLKLGGEYNPVTVDFMSCLCPGEKNDTLAYNKTTTAEPSLKFEVIISPHEGEPYRREFLWTLPQNHQSRLLTDLYRWALEEYERSGNALPAFAVPYMTEIFMARDEEEVNRLLGSALRSGKCSMADLLSAEGIDNEDEVKPLLVELSRCYQLFLKEFKTSGFFSALDKRYDALRKAYCAAYERYLEKSGESALGPLLMKAFMIVSDSDLAQTNWVWNEYLQCAVVTPLHPALLEMLRHQHAYLCESFCVYAKRGLEESGDRMFTEKRWDRVSDLSRIQWPIFGTLKDLNLVLDTNVRSYGYIHLVGECRESSSSISSRLLLEYDNTEDEEIADTELFRETRDSQLIKQVLLDYRELHTYADDGISIGAYCGREIQPVIAGIDAYLAAILAERGERVYALHLIIFSDSGDDSAIMRWVNAWKDRWQEAELSHSKQHYSNCRISIAYRVVSRDDNFGQFMKLLQGTDLDVIFFTNFIESGASRFELLGEDYYIQGDYRKFPVLEKVCCRVTGGGRDKQRERVLSNQRFRLGALHAEVMAHIKNGHSDAVKKHAVISLSDFQPWTGVIDAAHEHSAWVVCIDPAVDEQLLRRVETDGTRAREIIGFGTGVGPHGENNYTISTEQFAMADITKKISSQISALLGPLELDLSKRIAESLVREAAHIAGLSVVKATGPSRYVREFIANAMVRKLLRRDNSAFCDEIISLDAFRHWFDDAADGKRPDILRLQANIVDGYFEIKAQIIECKLAQQSEGYLEKARQQIESGLKQLATCFRPRETENPVGIDDKPDQRYWWMQLHRLIASKGETNRSRYKETLLALERLSEGYFNITWQAAAVAFWTDLDSDSMQCNPQWNFSLDGQNMVIFVATAGRNFIKKACLEDTAADIFCSESRISYSFSKSERKPGIDGGDDGVPEEPESGREQPEQVTKPSAGEGTSVEDMMGAGTTEEEPMGDDSSVVLVKRRIPERILLGSGTAGGRDVCWEFGHPDLPNRHILLFGASGTGKTYTIQALLCELGKAGQNSLIVDYTNGFTNKQLEPIVIEKLNPKQHVIRREPLAINPFRRQYDFIDDMQLEEDPATTAQRVSGVFAEVYQLGDQQKSALYNAIRDGVAREGNRFNLQRLMDKLDDIRNAGGPTANSAATVISKIQPFVDMNPFGEEDVESWEKLFTDPGSRCHIIQLAGFMKDTARLITEFSLIDLYWYYRARGNKDNPKVIVLDEIQNLDHRLDSPLGQFLTEGRKFGISLILATQTLSNLDKDQRDRLFQASHKLFFKPADTEVRSFAQILADATNGRIDEWVERLSSLKRGECYSLGYALNESTGKLEVSKWFKIRIKPLEQRF